MIPKNTKKIMLYLLRNLDLVNINQISNILDISVGSVFKILKGLEENKIVLCDNLGNAKFYKINFRSEESLKLCELLLIEERRILKGYPKIYANEIMNFEHGQLIILFGSVLKGREFNDVDVLFISKKPKQVADFCLNLSKIRSKPIIPLILNQEDLVKEIKNKKDAILDIIKTGIILKGESLFLDIIKNAKQ
ncbi:MAG: nucleotidyltransferase domain-containing protein [archaeon]